MNYDNYTAELGDGSSNRFWRNAGKALVYFGKPKPEYARPLAAEAEAATPV
jgi:hypothetical protein